MKKFLIAFGLIAGLGVLVAKTTFLSYARTAFTIVKEEASDAVSTSFELKRVQLEIAQLDRDMEGQIKPLAELKAALVQLERDIERQQISLADQRVALKNRVAELQKQESHYVFAGKKWTRDQFQLAVERDFESFKRQETHLVTLKKLQEAKQVALDASHEQLEKFQSKKREFTIRLAQLQAEEETLNVARLGSRKPADSRRPSQIEEALQEIERRQQVQRYELEFANQANVSPAFPPAAKTTDLSAISKHLTQGDH